MLPTQKPQHRALPLPLGLLLLNSCRPACLHSVGVALALKEHPNSIPRCFKHDCAERMLRSGRTEEDRSDYIGPTPTDAVCPRGTYGDNAKPLAARSTDGFAV